MNVLMLSTDARILEAGSDARERMQKYGTLFDELRIIVKTDAKNANEMRMMRISENVFAYSVSYNPFLWYRTARRILRQGGEWVITAQDPFEVGFGAWLLARRFRVPLQLQVHTDFLSPWFTRESWKNRIRVRLAKFLLPRADRIRVVSERIKQSLAHVPCPMSHVTVLPIFVDTDAIRRAPISVDLHRKYSDRFVVFMASRITREKNIWLALRAMQEIVKRFPKTLLLIVGDGPEKKNIQLLVTNYQLQNNVAFEPWTNDLASYYKTADCFLITSNYEGYGRTAVEAVAAGLPVVMTDVGLAGEVVRDPSTSSGQVANGLVAPVGDAGAVARALERIAGDAKLRGELTQGARRTEQAFQSEGAYLAAYRDALTVRPKLCFVAPAWRKGDATHFAYLKEFVREISKRFDVHLVVERGELPHDSGAVEVRLCDARFAPMRMIRTKLALFRARLHGCRTYYVHYSFFAAFTASWITRFTGGRVLYWNCGEPWKYRRPWLRERFERLTYRLINTLVTGTSGLADQYAKHYRIPREKVEVMPNWIHVDDMEHVTWDKEKLRKALKIPENHKVVLFVHRLSKRKGAHYLPEIIRAFRDEPVTFLVAGEGPERMNIERQVTRDMRQGDVRFLGSVPNPQLPHYYAIADVFLMPSEEEGFPHVLLEAMAFGVPFVATDVGGVRDIVPPEAQKYVVPPGNVSAFAAAVRMLLTSAPERRTASGAFPVWVKQYDLSRVLETFVAIMSGR